MMSECLLFSAGRLAGLDVMHPHVHLKIMATDTPRASSFVVQKPMRASAWPMTIPTKAPSKTVRFGKSRICRPAGCHPRSPSVRAREPHSNQAAAATWAPRTEVHLAARKFEPKNWCDPTAVSNKSWRRGASHSCHFAPVAT